MRLADRSTSLKTQQVAGPCRAKVKLPAKPVVIIRSAKQKGHLAGCPLYVFFYQLPVGM